MLKRLVFIVLLAAASRGPRAFASDGVLSVELIGGNGGPLLSAFAYGDFNWDGVVDAGDLPIWRDFFGIELFPVPMTSTGGEGIFDGRIDGGEFLAWQRNLGRNTFNVPASSQPTHTPSPIAAVPEPTSIVQALLAAAPLAFVRRRLR